MPLYLFNTAVWEAVWPIPVTAVVMAVVLSLVGTPEISWRDRFWVLLSFSMLGLITGVLSGLSRQSVIGAVLPPVLSLVGGLAIYLIGKDSSGRMLVSLSVLVLSFALFVGTTWGIVLREQGEEYKSSLNYLKRQALIEIQIQEFREALGLPNALTNQQTTTAKPGEK
jgi:hypothetical protein